MTASTLYYRSEDYSFLQIHFIRSCLGETFNVNVQADLSGDVIETFDANCKSMLLRTSDGTNITQRYAILRYIIQASGSQGAYLLGSNATEKSEIDQWLETCWQTIELPLQHILQLYAQRGSVDLETLEKSKANLTSGVAALNNYLDSRTYIAGEGISLADIAIFAVAFAIQELQVIDTKALSSYSRWYRSIAVSPKIQVVLKNSALVKTATGQGKEHAAQTATYTEKWDRHRYRVKELLQKGESLIGQSVVLKGWIRTSRSAEKGQVLFVELSDGSSSKSLQLVIQMETTTGAKDVEGCGGAGASLACVGRVVPSPAKGQTIEIHVSDVKVLGAVYGGENGEIGGKNYPMAKKQHTLEFLREKAHLRPRSKVFSAAMRMRHAMAYATHKFFNDRGFVYVHTPLITAADCEGAGEQFVVTTLLPDDVEVNKIPATKAGKVDYSKDFFSRRCCLTVSGQLNVETHACALSDVYTFGPTFRAENSHTARHLAEFWMIEPEICFADLVDDMALAEDYVKFCTAYALEHCADDLHYFEHEYPAGEKGLTDRLKNVVENDFARITYTEAVALLQKEVKEGKVQFTVYPQWGDDLGSEHERYITEQINKKPTIVINYPKAIKAFYMKVNDDNLTVAAMDLLVPKIGELIGGSQR